MRVVWIGLVGAMVGWLGCRGPGAVEPPGPQAAVVPEHDEAPPDPASASAGEPASAEPTARPAPVTVPEPPPLQSITPIELPFVKGALVVEAVRDQSPIVLFADETVPIRRGVGEYLAANGRSVVPVDELERIEEDAAAGRLRLEGDQTCRDSLSVEEVWARYFEGAPRATLEAQCLEGCVLQVTVSDPNDEEAFGTYATRRIRRPYDPRAWAKAKIHPVEGMFGIGGLGLSGSSHPPPIQFQWFDSIGPWARSPTGALVDALEPKVAGCAHPDPRVGFTYEIRASVGASGRVSRCTAHSEHSLAREVDAACLCEGLQALRYPPGPAGRRFRVDAKDTGGFTPFDRQLEVLQPGTEPWVRRIGEAMVLSSCMASNPPGGSFEATMVLSLAADGAVEAAEVLGDITTMPKMKLSSCLVSELRAVSLPCRPPGIDTLQVGISVIVK